ncbi:hypothetical protein J2741_000260 [Methanolinea mesophila]|uniref:hypothetical protein n=1 Tax=Methanolinea mesophila TaxID=547055 RepID=UPI001AE83213|nr:hypothetical protein [Methanolinea mesophila]MBP1927713.1 hypothetical protein [Methanolinea mesophila]
MKIFDEPEVELVESCTDAGSVGRIRKAGAMNLPESGEDDRIRRDLWILSDKNLILHHENGEPKDAGQILHREREEPETRGLILRPDGETLYTPNSISHRERQGAYDTHLMLKPDGEVLSAPDPIHCPEVGALPDTSLVLPSDTTRLPKETKGVYR